MKKSNHALVLVDVQNGFITKRTKQVPRNIVRIIQTHKFGQIIFTVLKNHPQSGFVRFLKWRKMQNKPAISIVKELQPWVHTDNVFEKDTYGVFQNKKFVQFLKKYRIKKLSFTGIDTENCVSTIAREAFDRGYEVALFKKGCGSHSNPAAHRAAVRLFEDALGEVV